MAELVDALVSNTSEPQIRVGSTPTQGTSKKKADKNCQLFLFRKVFEQSLVPLRNFRATFKILSFGFRLNLWAKVRNP